MSGNNSESTRGQRLSAAGFSPPYLATPGSSREGSVIGGKGPRDSQTSLAVNYIPSKFSPAMINNNVGPRRRKGKGGLGDMVPKRGGGVEAFRSGQARMPSVNDEDYDGVDDTKNIIKRSKRLRWNRFKWLLFFANTLLTIYSISALAFCLTTWFNVWTHADIVRVSNNTELILSTIAAGVGIITSVLGWAGILLNNRAFLAVYCLLTWITFAFLVVPGYITYRKRTFNLEGKLNAQWSRTLGVQGRMRIQNELGCCGYFSPFVEATVSTTCYARSILPGCKKHYLDFERLVLKRWYTVSFTLVPLQLFVMVVGLLCSNHITYRFGKGMMPKAYRLSMGSMAVIMDQYANQLAEQYGSDVAADLLKDSRSNLTLQMERTKSSTFGSRAGTPPISMSAMPTMPYQSGLQPVPQLQHVKYDSVGKRTAPEAL